MICLFEAISHCSSTAIRSRDFYTVTAFHKSDVHDCTCYLTFNSFSILVSDSNDSFTEILIFSLLFILIMIFLSSRILDDWAGYWAIKVSGANSSLDELIGRQPNKKTN